MKLTTGNPEILIVRGGRTGRKVHRMWRGSSCLACGRWVRAGAPAFEIPQGTEIAEANMCKKCFPEGTRTQAQEEQR